MRRLKTWMAGLAILLLGTAAHAGTVTLDFESVAPGTVISNEFASDGVTFSSNLDPGTNPRISASYGGTRTLADLSRDITNPLATFNIRADFADAVSNLIVDVTAANGVQSIVSIFDTGGLLINSITSGVQTLGIFETLNLGGTDISYALFETTSPIVAAAIIDNLTYDVSPVPLPAGLPLLVAGLGAFGVMRRRKAASS